MTKNIPEWVGALGPIAAQEGCDAIPVWCVDIALPPWRGPELAETQRNKSIHCGKGRGLVVGRDGQLS